MKDYIDHFSIANTVRMVGDMQTEVLVALVERDTDMRKLYPVTRQYGYYAVNAHSHDNLLGAVQILAGDGWQIGCSRRPRGARMGDNSLGLLEHVPPFVAAWEGIRQKLQEPLRGEFCFAASPSDEDETGKDARDGENQVPSARQRRKRPNKSSDKLNARRVFLIRKRFRDGLLQEEEDELAHLQAEMSEHVNSSLPLPFDALDELEEFVEQAERRLSNK